MSTSPLDRREFLITGAGLAAAAIASPHSILGANDRVGIGLVGCGGRGAYLLNEAIAAAPGRIQVVGLCDVWSQAREKMAATVAEKLPGQTPRLVSRHEELLKLPGLDGVIIASPDFAHPTALVDAVRAGKDAFVEKPLSARLEDAAAALDAVEKADRVVQGAETQRREQRTLPRGRRGREVRSARPDLQGRDGLEPEHPELDAADRHDPARRGRLGSVPDVSAEARVRREALSLLAPLLRIHDGPRRAARTAT